MAVCSDVGAAPGSRPPKQPRRAAIESLTATEAVWHIVVFGLFTSAYLFAASWARYSVVLSLAIVTALGVAAAGGAAAVPSVSEALRSEALRSLREAVAGGEPDRIRAAIKHAQAVGVSEEDAATAEELRAAVFGKLHRALQDGNKRRVSAAVRCARAVEIRREELASALCVRPGRPEAEPADGEAKPAKGGEGQAGPLEAEPTAPCVQSTWPTRSLGLAPEEVAFAERVVTSGSGQDEESRNAEVLVLYPRHCPPSADRGSFGDRSTAIRQAMTAALDAREEVAALAVQRPSGPAAGASEGASGALRELHAAIESCSVQRMRDAISEAKAAAVGADELAFAEAMLEIESSRERQAALQAKARSLHPGMIVGGERSAGSGSMGARRKAMYADQAKFTSLSSAAVGEDWQSL